MTMDALMARVGYLFLYWGFLENEVKRRHGDLSSLVTAPGVWEARRIRNLIAHGISEANVAPGDDGPTYLSCKPQDGGAPERVTLDELETAISALERARFSVA